ncbi:hypothetical protein ACFP1I_08925 [Dyadobacter subterraneus]|uniref:hypothetical protein n=1 Tax=Dyadobacter subterraneus TaxID=2773304 RepID=UPI001D164FC1|nr:hypothetical protein [Dyadobacter subterraneus]
MDLIQQHSHNFLFGFQGGTGKSNRDGAKTIGGGGINLRVFASPNLALGVAAKLYADGNTYGIGNNQYKTTGALMPLTGTLDYYFATGVVRPYIGGDAGVYLSNYDVNHNGKNIYTSDKSSNFGAAPRAGIVFALGKTVGIQVEGIYHYIFNNKNHQLTTGDLGNIDFKSTSRFYGFNVGLIIGLGRGND